MDKLSVVITNEKTESEITLVKGELVCEELACVNFYVNDESLIKLVGEKLAPHDPSPNYGYLGLEPKDVLIPYSDILIEPEKTESYLKEENAKILISCCALCGMALCHAFALRVTVNEDTVVWDQIGRWDDTRTEGIVGPFTFDRREYEEIIRIENAEFETGWALDNGVFVEKNQKEALKYFKRAAEKGHVMAHYYLGWYYSEGFAGRKNFKKALTHYRIAADGGDVWSMTNVGRMYALGIGTKRDYNEAVKWYQKAADLGDPLAMTNLAWCYEHGKGVEEDGEEALLLYLRAADLEEPNAIEWLDNYRLACAIVESEKGEADESN